MTDREDIIKLAREANIGTYINLDSHLVGNHLERFAILVADAEREACAKVCEEYETANDITAAWLNIVADAIRARGQA